MSKLFTKLVCTVRQTACRQNHVPLSTAVIQKNTCGRRCSKDFSKSQTYTAKRYIKIYTRTGDGGMSATFTGERRPKDDALFEALGSTDELSSALGMAREFSKKVDHPFVGKLEEIQCVLQEISSNIATPKSTAREKHLQMTTFDASHVDDLENWIDYYADHLPPLKNFILPSGGKPASSLHMARAICRRTERRVAPLVRDGEMDVEPLKYLNRLSDFLFTAARFAAFSECVEEKIYRRKAPANADSEKTEEQETT